MIQFGQKTQVSTQLKNLTGSQYAKEALPGGISPKILLESLQAGKVFSGTILDIRNGQVTIGLSSGETLVAKMSENVELGIGQMMSFQVQENDGKIIAIRPYGLEELQNKMFLKALEAANLTVNEKNKKIVQAMLREQMPIDRSSIQNMVRQTTLFPEANIKTLAQMVKLQLPLTKESIIQFENYKNEQHAMLTDIEQITNDIPKILQDSSLSLQEKIGFQEQLLPIFQETAQGEERPITQILSIKERNVLAHALERMGEPLKALGIQLRTGAITVEQFLSKLTEGIPKVLLNNTETNLLEVSVLEQSNNVSEKEVGVLEQGKHILEKEVGVLEQGKHILEKEVGVLEQSKHIPEKAVGVLEQSGNVFEKAVEISEQNSKNSDRIIGSLEPGKEQINIGRELNLLEAAFGKIPLKTDILEAVFGSKEYAKVLKELVERRWLVEPAQVANKEQMQELYKNLASQAREVAQLLESMGKESSVTAKAAHNVKSNVEFMNALNQLYTYVQIPLKMLHQNAHSDLYVYTNKKNLQDETGELSALLHLELEELGTTDIFVKMNEKDVDTQFFLEKEEAYQLVKAYAPKLKERLDAKGYSCNITVENREKEEKYVENFLSIEQPVGEYKCFSFDTRA